MNESLRDQILSSLICCPITASIWVNFISALQDRFEQEVGWYNIVNDNGNKKWDQAFSEYKVEWGILHVAHEGLYFLDEESISWFLLNWS